jgi:SAM-dependent methyltransferase
MTTTEDTRAFYDTIAEDYADHFRGVHLTKPLDRAVLAAFAELVERDRGPVADLGCGPGWITAHLASLGLPVFGLDLSEGMLTVARRHYPELPFEQGSMLELPVADEALGGAVSWYSTIHTPLDRLPALFAEIRRVLAPGAPLLTAFQAGDVPRRHDRPFGHRVTLDFERRRPELMAELLQGAGFDVRHRLVSEPDEALGEPTPHAYLIARR